MKNYFEIIDSINNISSIDKSKLIKKKIKFLCNFNSFQLQAYLEYYLKKKDILSEIIESDFDQIHQQIIKIKKEDKERHEQLLNRAASRVSAREQQVRTKNCIHEKFP